uniref:Putative secreted protein n=1 Tax=Anopheles darlingi TaxID=43151 RepID=A0A2M4DFU0_ANODA
MVASLVLSLSPWNAICLCSFSPLGRMLCCALLAMLQRAHTWCWIVVPSGPGEEVCFHFSGPLCSMIRVRHPRSRVLLLFYYASTNASSKVSLLPPLASRHFRDRFPVPGSTTPSAIN